jgi:ribosomal protein L37AE/L43A
MTACPFCGETEMIERDGARWFCIVCSRMWMAFTEKDRRFLAKGKIAAE